MFKYTVIITQILDVRMGLQYMMRVARDVPVKMAD